MSEYQQRQKIESAVRRFLKRVIRNGGTLPNGAHPVIDSEVYRLVSTEVSRQCSHQSEGKVSVKDICDRLIPLIHARREGQRFNSRTTSTETVAFNSQCALGETILV
jgi:hypothetical protein